MLYGKIFDSNTGIPLDLTKVTIFNSKNEVVLETFPPHDGTFSLDINCKEGTYKMITFKEGYHFSYTLLDRTTMTLPLALEVSLRKRK